MNTYHSLYVYTTTGSSTDTLFPSAEEPLIISRYTFNEKRMGPAPTITSKVKYHRNLDSAWSRREYVRYKGERYYIQKIPSSQKNNESIMYESDVTFVSERIILEGTFFLDVVTEDSDLAYKDRYRSNDTKVYFYGTLSELVSRLNDSMKYSRIDYNIVIDEGVDVEDTKQITFDSVYLLAAIQKIYSEFGVPYYFVGKTIHVGYSQNTVEHTFEYGCEGGLLSMSKNNKNEATVNRITGIGGEKNLPYYYPNETPYGRADMLVSDDIGNNNVDVNLHLLNTAFERPYQKFRIAKMANDHSFLPSVGHTTASVGWAGGYYTGYITFIFQAKLHKDDIVDVNHFLRIVNIWFDTYSQPTPSTGIYSPPKLETYLLTGTSEIFDTSEKLAVSGNYRIKIRLYVDSVPYSGSGGLDTTSPIKYSNAFLPIRRDELSVIDEDGNIASIKDAGINIDGLDINRLTTFQYNAIRQGNTYKTEVVLDTSQYDSFIEVKGRIWMQPSKNLMPPIYRNSLGAERFYDAKNNTYKVKDTNSYYTFEDLYSNSNAHEHKETFSEIVPSIENMTNTLGQAYGTIIDVAFDDDDNDLLGGESNNPNEPFTGDAEYSHSYFYIKLPKFNGEYGFNLFEQGLEGGTMTIEMTSGNCAGCKFEVGVYERTEKDGTIKFYNPVKVDGNGNIVEGSYRDKIISKSLECQDVQQDTSTHSVWIAVKKDGSTFPTVMPNSEWNYKPKPNDKFVITGISLPNEYIRAAENKLEENLIEYMSEHNSDKFSFSINMSRVWLKTNPDIAAQINVNSKIRVLYDNNEYLLYVSGITIEADGESLCEVSVELSEELVSNETKLYSMMSDVALKTTFKAFNDIDLLSLLNRFVVRKDIDDITYNSITIGRMLSVIGNASINGDTDINGCATMNGNTFFGRNFVSGITGAGGMIDNTGHGELESLTLRRFLEVPELRYNRITIQQGTVWVVSAAGIVESTQRNITNSNKGTLKLKLEQGEIGSFAVDDICMGIFHNENDLSENETETSDNGEGIFTYAGFCTVYFRVVDVSDYTDSDGTIYRNAAITYTLREASSRWSKKFHPSEGMHIVAYGNFSDPTRQSSFYQTTTYWRFLKNVNNWDFGWENVASQWGDCSNLTVNGKRLTKDSFYISNGYFSGTIEQIDAIPITLTATPGTMFLDEGESTDVELRLTKGGLQDYTDGSRFRIQRSTGDEDADRVWNQAHNLAQTNNIITLSYDDISHDVSTVFTITAVNFAVIPPFTPDNPASTTLTLWAKPKDGTKGDDAVEYRLVPEHDSINLDTAQLNEDDAFSTSCRVIRISGGEIEELNPSEYNGNNLLLIAFSYNAASDGGDYARSENSLNIPKDTSALSWYLYRRPDTSVSWNNATLIYSKDVAIVRNGEKGERGYSISNMRTLWQTHNDGVNPPTGTWSEDRQTMTDAQPFLWQKMTWDVDSTHNESAPSCIGYLAKDGVGSYSLDLDNEMACVAIKIRESDGLYYPIPSPNLPYAVVSTGVAIHSADTTATISDVQVEHISGAQASNVSVSGSTVTILFGSNSARTQGEIAEYRISAACNKTDNRLSKIMSVLFMSQGTDGKNPVIYQLKPDHSSVNLSDGAVTTSCKIVRIVGDSVEVLDSIPSDMSGLLALQAVINGGPIPIRPSVPVSIPANCTSFGWTLGYRKTTSESLVMIDKEDVAIVRNGIDGDDGKDAVVYSVSPTSRQVKMSEEYGYIPEVIGVSIKKTIGSTVTDITNQSGYELWVGAFGTDTLARSTARTFQAADYPNGMTLQVRVGGVAVATNDVTVVYDGAKGQPAVNHYITMSSNIVCLDKDGVYSPNSVTATAYVQQGDEDPSPYYGFWRIYVDGILSTDCANTASPTISHTINTDKAVEFRLYKEDKQTLLDSQTVHILRDGTPGKDGFSAITAILSNESHTIPVNKEGVPNYTGSGTKLEVYEGTTLLTRTTRTLTNGQYNTTITTDGVVGTAASGSTTCIVGNITNMAADTGTRTIAISGLRTNGDSFSLTRVQSFSRTYSGTDGKDGLGFAFNEFDGCALDNIPTMTSSGWNGNGFKYSAGTATRISNDSPVSGTKSAHIIASAQWYPLRYSGYQYAPKTSYVFSFYVKGDNGRVNIMMLSGVNVDTTTIDTTKNRYKDGAATSFGKSINVAWVVTGTWTRCSVAFTTSENIAPNNHIHFVVADGSDLYISAPKLEVDCGTHYPTPWTPSKDDIKGESGIAGAIYRTSDWVAGKQYLDGNTYTDPNMRFIDVVFDDSNNAYVCTSTHTSTASTRPGSGQSWLSVWQKMNSMTPIHTKLILADNAKIDFGQFNQLFMQGADGTIKAGLCGTDDSSKPVIFAGAGVSDTDEAPFRVYDDGSVVANDMQLSGSFTRMMRQKMVIVSVDGWHNEANDSRGFYTSERYDKFLLETGSSFDILRSKLWGFFNPAMSINNVTLLNAYKMGSNMVMRMLSAPKGNHTAQRWCIVLPSYINSNGDDRYDAQWDNPLWAQTREIVGQRIRIYNDSCYDYKYAPNVYLNNNSDYIGNISISSGDYFQDEVLIDGVVSWKNILGMGDYDEDMWREDAIGYSYRDMMPKCFHPAIGNDYSWDGAFGGSAARIHALRIVPGWYVELECKEAYEYWSYNHELYSAPNTAYKPYKQILYWDVVSFGQFRDVPELFGESWNNNNEIVQTSWDRINLPWLDHYLSNIYGGEYWNGKRE